MLRFVFSNDKTLIGFAGIIFMMSNFSLCSTPTIAPVTAVIFFSSSYGSANNRIIIPITAVITAMMFVVLLFTCCLEKLLFLTIAFFIRKSSGSAVNFPAKMGVYKEKCESETFNTTIFILR